MDAEIVSGAVLAAIILLIAAITFFVDALKRDLRDLVDRK